MSVQMKISKNTAAYVHMLPKVSLYKLPQRERWGAACVKLLQILHSINNKSMLNDFSREEECLQCHVLAEIVLLV